MAQSQSELKHQSFVVQAYSMWFDGRSSKIVLLTHFLLFVLSMYAHSRVVVRHRGCVLLTAWWCSACTWPATGVAMSQDCCNACCSHISRYQMQVVEVAKLDLVQTINVETNIGLNPFFIHRVC